MEKKTYISPELEIFEAESESIMGDFFSKPKTDKVDDDPTEVFTPDLSLDDVDDDEDAIVTSKRGHTFNFGWD